MSAYVFGKRADQLAAGDVILHGDYRWRVQQTRTCLGYTTICLCHTDPVDGMEPARQTLQRKCNRSFTLAPQVRR